MSDTKKQVEEESGSEGTTPAASTAPRPAGSAAIQSRWTAQRVVLTTLGAVLVGLGFWFVFRFYNVAFILFSALVLGTVIRPGRRLVQPPGAAPPAGCRAGWPLP